jgi:DNA topoisomerase-1
MGHVKDLPKSKLGVDIDKDFEPQYLLLQNKKKSVAEIKESAEKAKRVFLATDPDREGEAIAHHVREILGDQSLEPRRIVFHEITKDAVEKAIKDPRDIDENLVNAQIARRVLDRLVGYKLSPLLWKKVRRGLSAGRVQSVAVRLIVEREREIEGFEKEEYWEIHCKVKSQKSKVKNDFLIKLVKKIDNKQDADAVVTDLKKAKYLVSDVKKREVKKYPFPPFTTSTLTQTAAGFWGWSAKKTMSVAQRLYEEGLITYHRTDSINIAKMAIDRVRDYIKKEFGDTYLPAKPYFYKTKSKVAQEAHEAIRPTKVSHQPSAISHQQDAKRLYELIWERFVACQMAPSVYDETTIEVEARNTKDYLLRTSGQVMKFDGWRKVLGSNNGKEAIRLPEVREGEELHLIKVIPEQKFTQPPARYNEASLIKALENLGIGRPSTYAPIITTIQLRNYVEKKERRFYPTSVGIAVNDFLVNNFPKVFNYSFTAQMEDDLDKIANGKRSWKASIKTFWNPFEKKLKSVEEKSARVKIKVEKLGRKCPKCKDGELVIRIGRFGKFISCSRFPDCDHTEKYIEKIGVKCPECIKKDLPAGRQGDVIIKKTGRGKKFYGCSRYPNCKWASWRKPRRKTATGG